MTSEELKDWAASLKPGDKVIQFGGYFDELTNRIETVRRITPLGNVVTEYGKYRITNWTSKGLVGFGKTDGLIVPYGEIENMPESIRKSMIRRFEKDEKVRKIIYEAKQFCADIAHGKIEISKYDARELLMFKRYMTKNADG